MDSCHTVDPRFYWLLYYLAGRLAIYINRDFYPCYFHILRYPCSAKWGSNMGKCMVIPITIHFGWCDWWWRVEFCTDPWVYGWCLHMAEAHWMPLLNKLLHNRHLIRGWNFPHQSEIPLYIGRVESGINVQISSAYMISSYFLCPAAVLLSQQCRYMSWDLEATEGWVAVPCGILKAYKCFCVQSHFHKKTHLLFLVSVEQVCIELNMW